MRPPPFCFILALAALAAAPPPLRAQEGTVGGVVLVESSRMPLADVQVRVQGTDLRAVTGANGRFLLSGLAGAEVVLEARRIEYRLATVTVRVGDMDVRVLLAEKIIELEAVVVTGTPGEVQQRQLGNAVGRITAEELSDAPVSTVQDALSGREVSVVVIPPAAPRRRAAEQPEHSLTARSPG